MTTLAAPPSPSPTRPPRGPGARSLTIVGVVVGALLVLATAWSAVQVLALGWSDHATTTASATYAPRATVELVADGDVAVTTGDSDAVVVERTAHVALGHATYSAQLTADRLVVHHSCPDFLSSCSAGLSVRVPSGTTLIVRTSDGRLAAHGLVGALEAHVGDGPASVGDVHGDVQVTTGNGYVDVREVTGSVTARSGDGGIHVDGVTGDATVHSSDGRVDVGGVQGDVDASSGDGDVTVRSTGEPVALDISTSDGHQTVQAPTDPAASRHVRIHSSDGDVAFLGPRG